jgi:hypothetical protein
MSYTNLNQLQYEFKRLGFRKLNDNESDADVRIRNREIAHWSRGLYESVHCFGTVMSKKKKRRLFHGISCKLVFDRFAQQFLLPTSLTTSRVIAERFAKQYGIVLELSHARDKDVKSLAINVKQISKFPQEKEYLIMRSKVKFCNMFINNTSHQKWVQLLVLWEKIRLGYFLFNENITDEQQASLVSMIDNYIQMKSRQKYSINNSNNENILNLDLDYVYPNGDIPNYIQLCFNKSTDSSYVFVLNSTGIQSKITNKQLLAYLSKTNLVNNQLFLVSGKQLLDRRLHVCLQKI